MTAQSSSTEALLQAVSPVDANTVWVSGHQGVVRRTTDGGGRWQTISTPAGDSLQFRDVHGFSNQEAVILSAGTGPVSRIYHTEDGGGTWQLAYLMTAPDGFLDCLDFWDDRGFAYGDEVDGVPFILVTDDGGRSWRRAGPEGLPAAIDGEGGFAASGTCARAGSDGTGWIATGASGAARILRTTDYGATWSAAEVPVVRGDAAGLTTVSMDSDDEFGVAFGGDLANMDGRTENAAVTTDGGSTWAPASAPALIGPVYGSALVPGTQTVVVVGPSGADLSRDGGQTWQSIATDSFWAVASAGPGATWMAGPEGRIVKIELR